MLYLSNAHLTLHAPEGIMYVDHKILVICFNRGFNMVWY